MNSQHNVEKPDTADASVGGKIKDDGLVDLDIEPLPEFLDAFKLEEANIVNPEGCGATSSHLQICSSPSLPRLNVVIQVVGSLGDVQPFVPIAKELQSSGHRVRLATHIAFKPLIEANDIEFFDIGGDPGELMAFMVRNPGLIPSGRAAMNGEVGRKQKIVRQMLEGCWKSCFEPSEALLSRRPWSPLYQPRNRPFVADAIIANPPSFPHHCAERLGIPLHLVFTMPWSPTRAFPHPLARIKSTKIDPSTMNVLSYFAIDMMIWQGLRSEINAFRRDTLLLEPLSPTWTPMMLNRLSVPTTYCWSPSLLPKPMDWPEEITVAGYCSTSDALDEYTPSVDLLDFIHSGPPPIYIGFGSIVVDDTTALENIVLEAIKLSGKRAICGRGWSELGSRLSTSDNVFVVQYCPHAWLFKHVACVVHHGGGGTTAAGLKAGRPTVTVPFFGDQFFWAKMVESIGAGPPSLPYKELTAENLAAAIKMATQRNLFQSLDTISAALSAEQGASVIIDKFHKYLPWEALRCSLDPSRPVAWRIKKAGRYINVSTFAAAVLESNGLVKDKDLRHCKLISYMLDYGPLEPVSGGMLAVTSLFYNVFKGMSRVVTGLDAFVPPSNATNGSKTTGKKEVYALTHSSPVTANDATEVSENPGLVSLKGCGKVIAATARSPMTFSLALAKGAHNAPRIWGDSTVREVDPVTGIGSGIVVGCKELFLGTYDGIAGLVRLPLIGAREAGPLGALKGIGKGLAGAPVKMFSAMAAPVGYPLKGVDASINSAFNARKRDPVRQGKIDRGQEEVFSATAEEKTAVLEAWLRINDHDLV